MSHNIPPFSEASKTVKVGAYEHYKGLKCEVMAVARHSEDLSEYVVYKELEDGSVWVRPLAMFVEEIEKNGKRMPRFRYVGERW